MVKVTVVKAIIVNRQKNKKKSETKLRLIRNSHFGLKAYLKDTKASDLLMLKLNMIDLKANYTAKYKDSILVEDAENIKCL